MKNLKKVIIKTTQPGYKPNNECMLSNTCEIIVHVNNDTHIADRIVPYIFKDKFSKEFSFCYFYAELSIRLFVSWNRATACKIFRGIPTVRCFNCLTVNNVFVPIH